MSRINVMKAAIFSNFGKASDELKIITDRVKPTPKPNEVLIQVKAASINPIDTRMRAGYGRNIFTSTAPLPWVLGRDFSGVVASIGEKINNFKVGDKIFGVASPFQSCSLENGSHAEYVCVPESDVAIKPDNINYIEASSLPYVALTTYAALIIESRMKTSEYAGKHVFVQAGAGGVGSYAIQFLKALGATVSTTCSEKNIEFVRSLGADSVIDYNSQDYTKLVYDADVVFDLLGKNHTQHAIATLKSTLLSDSKKNIIDHLYNNCLEQTEKMDIAAGIPQYKEILKSFDIEAEVYLSKTPTYVSIVGPLMPLTDKYGYQLGIKKYISEVLKEKVKQIKLGRRFNYSVFQPNKIALNLLSDQIASGLILPNVRKTFPLLDVISAHSEMEKGHGYGKIVLVM